MLLWKNKTKKQQRGNDIIVNTVPITARGVRLASCHLIQWSDASGCKPADGASCPPAGGIVPGDELMAVNRKVLLDAALSEGQNSLTRAWNSGGVRLAFQMIQTLLFKWRLAVYWTLLVRIDWLEPVVVVTVTCAPTECYVLSLRIGSTWWLPFPLRNNTKTKCKHSRRRVTQQPKFQYYFFPPFRCKFLWFLKPQYDGRGLRLSLCACVYAALSQHQSVLLPTERCLKAVQHCTDTATCFSTSPPSPPPPPPSLPPAPVIDREFRSPWRRCMALEGALLWCLVLFALSTCDSLPV